jgi:hypothetical protein
MPRIPRIVLTDDELNRLPVLGVSWTTFPTIAEAVRYQWRVEYGTRHHKYPCEVEVTMDETGEVEVKTWNW